MCEGRVQEASKPCAGKCPLSKERQFSETDNEYDYGSNQYGGSLDYKMNYGDNLYGDMVFVQPIQFPWKMLTASVLSI